MGNFYLAYAAFSLSLSYYTAIEMFPGNVIFFNIGEYLINNIMRKT